MTENNENNLSSADDDMFEELKQKYKEAYSPREKCVQKMKKVFSAKEIYLITLIPKKNNKNKVYLLSISWPKRWMWLISVKRKPMNADV